MSKKVNVDADDDIDVRDHPAAHRFDVWVGDQRAGFTHYVDRGNGVVAFVHTEMKPEFEHRGLAGRLIGDGSGRGFLRAGSGFRFGGSP